MDEMPSLEKQAATMETMALAMARTVAGIIAGPGEAANGPGAGRGIVELPGLWKEHLDRD